MLPTHGLFRSIPCPYYVSGLCERPHCLFRHTKSDVLLARKLDLATTSDGEEAEPQTRETISEGSGEDKAQLSSRGLKRKAESQLIHEKEGKSHCVEVDRISGEGGGETKGEGKSTRVDKTSVENKTLPTSNSRREVKESSTSSSDHRRKSSSGSSSSKRSSRSSLDNTKIKDKKSSSSSRDKQDSTNHHRSHSSKSPDKSHKSSSRSSSSNNNKSSSPHKSSRSSSSSSGSKDKSKSKTLSESRSKSKSDSSETIIKKEISSVTTVPDDDDDDEVKILDPSKAEDLPSSVIYEDEENFNLPELSDYEDDPDDIELECLRLFQDYQPEVKSPDKKIAVGNQVLPLQGDPGRKRQAHPGASEKKPTLSTSFRKPTSTLHEQIAKRIESQKKIVNSQTEVTKKIIPTSSSSVQVAKHQAMSGPHSLSSGSNITSNKKRIAHVPNVSGLLKPSIPADNQSAKSPLKSSSSTTPSSSYSTVNITLSRTSDKGVPRVAHSAIISSNNKKKGPLVNVDAPAKGIGKIPVISRQKVLDQLFDAAILVHGNYTEAFKRAIEEEASLQIRSKTKAIYASLAVSKVRAIRKEGEDQQNRLEQKGQSLTSPGAKPEKVVSTRPTGQSLYQGLKNVILKEEDLVSNGFPRSHPNGEPGCATATLGHWNTEYISEQTRRTCDRCHKVFNVDETGVQTANEGSCIYHSGRKAPQQVNRAWKVTYSCCGDERGSPGCSTAVFHVPKSHPVTSTRGFVSAVKAMGSDETMGTNRWDVVAIDCEMVYTTGGSELARATFLDNNGEVIYDELVKPQHPVLDYNTKFSGLTEAMMDGVTNTLNSVQAVLLTQLKPNSILVGHSLESDLIALRLKHDFVVDTSLLYPHRRGLPYKRGLKMLSQEHLRRLIQESADGHDSAEDARAALDLAVSYVQQNMHHH